MIRDGQDESAKVKRPELVRRYRKVEYNCIGGEEVRGALKPFQGGAEGLQLVREANIPRHVVRPVGTMLQKWWSKVGVVSSIVSNASNTASQVKFRVLGGRQTVERRLGPEGPRLRVRWCTRRCPAH